MKQQPNTLYPGRPNYTGPTEGIFGLVHHDTLAEPSADIMERVKYIRKKKHSSEIKTRLHCLVWLPPQRLSSTLWKVHMTEREAYKAKQEGYGVWQKIGLSSEDRTEAYQAWRETDIIWQKTVIAWQKVYRASTPEIWALIQELVPDCPWNGEELVF